MKWFWLGIIVFLVIAVTGLLLRNIPSLIEGGNVDASVEKTQISLFDPSTITIDSDTEPQPALCSYSAVVGNNGAYACQTTAGSIFDPCFVIDDLTLMCQPNPPLDSYQMLVTVEELPEEKESGSIPIAFVLQFPDRLTCNILPNAKQFNAYTQTYSCNAPTSGIIDQLDTSGDVWTARFFTQNPTTGQITFGPENRSVSAVWLW